MPQKVRNWVPVFGGVGRRISQKLITEYSKDCSSYQKGENTTEQWRTYHCHS